MSHQDERMLLNDKIAVVTGANRGIGDAIVRTFVAHGARVIACVRDPHAPATTAWLASLNDATREHVQTVPLELADEASVKAAVKTIAALTSRVDVLVNNAGTASGGLMQMTTMAELRRVFDINFFGQVLFTQSVSRLMARHKSGSIINLASTAALIADAGTLAYGTSKAAFARATESMATELGASGIRVNAIAPGPTRTDMYEQMTPAARERLVESSALKRAGEPQDVANVALFLASNLSAFMSGQILRVDGGIV
jgi:3-oxoacyl-[acyl-carrier protein] reductase